MVFVTQANERRTADRRITKRWLAHVTCGVRGPDGVASSVILSNISEGGFGAKGAFGMGDGDQLTFRLGRAGHAQARVVWRSGEKVGCQFLRHVSAAEVALALATATPVTTDDVTSEPGRV